jgi:hypothetical protein
MKRRNTAVLLIGSEVHEQVHTRRVELTKLTENKQRQWRGAADENGEGDHPVVVLSVRGVKRGVLGRRASACGMYVLVRV